MAGAPDSGTLSGLSDKVQTAQLLAAVSLYSRDAAPESGLALSPVAPAMPSSLYSSAVAEGTSSGHTSGLTHVAAFILKCMRRKT